MYYQIICFIKLRINNRTSEVMGVYLFVKQLPDVRSEVVLFDALRLHHQAVVQRTQPLQHTRRRLVWGDGTVGQVCTHTHTTNIVVSTLLLGEKHSDMTRTEYV